MAIQSNPFDAQQLRDDRAEQEDPLVMYYVVRKDWRATPTELLQAAGKGASCLVALMQSDSHHSERLERWYQQSYRKVALRADADQLAEIAATTAGYSTLIPWTLECTMMTLVPMAKSERSELLASLPAYTDPKRVAAEPRMPLPGAMTVVINGELKMNTGKLMAQVGHAVLMCESNEQLLRDHEQAFDEWHTTREIDVRRADAEQWQRLMDTGEGVVVRDAGLTQVAANSETVIALVPSKQSHDELEAF